MEETHEEEEENEVYRPMDSMLAPIFIQMMKNSERENPRADMDSQLQEILRRRGRRPVSVEQLLQGIQRGRVIVTNPYNQIVANPSSAVSDTLPPVAGSLSEYFIGSEFEAMLERSTETDPRRYGTPPARRDAVEALVNVVILVPGLQCLVCLEDFEVGTMGKQMRCEHSFHSYCLLYWLQLHSSCPVCRCQLPTAEDETNGVGGGSSSTSSSSQGSENSDQEEDPMAA
ncbi:hypothetical protein Bca52824_033207 [Brassica carinata]|uniref:RING-type E3 ubiquitin transferase n=1 Tax=Brassica carinata TaxID=52824 RepID=A0A8X7SDT1_BRACI|nr:hypothetical protein Bca52824_033207 [Brassica carinata]